MVLLIGFCGLLSLFSMNAFVDRPLVLIHGIGGSASDMNDLMNAYENEGLTTYALSIKNSIFGDMNDMCKSVADQIEMLPINHTNTSINLLGVSQGGLLARCYVERYSHKLAGVDSLITYGTPHMGIYYKKIPIPLLHYWKDPFYYEEYLEGNKFLKYMNNDVGHNESELFRKNMEGLEHFQMIWSGYDAVIQPVESAAFEFYNISLAREERKLEIESLKHSSNYLQNKIGLMELSKKGGLEIWRYDCSHEEFKHPKCFFEYKINDKSIFNHSMELFKHM